MTNSLRGWLVMELVLEDRIDSDPESLILADLNGQGAATLLIKGQITGE